MQKHSFVGRRKTDLGISDLRFLDCNAQITTDKEGCNRRNLEIPQSRNQQ